MREKRKNVNKETLKELNEKHRKKKGVNAGAVMVAKWSECSPSTLMIRARIPLKPTIFLLTGCLEKTKINKKRPGLAH